MSKFRHVVHVPVPFLDQTTQIEARIKQYKAYMRPFSKEGDVIVYVPVVEYSGPPVVTIEVYEPYVYEPYVKEASPIKNETDEVSE